MTNLAPDLAVCDHFLEYCTGGEDVAFRTFNDQDSANTLPIKLYGQLEDVAVKLTQENQKGSGVFWVVNKSDSNKQTDAAITQVRALFVDLDGAELAPVINANIRPHILIESSPRKYHGYWLVSGNFPVADFSRFQKALARKFNGDPVVSNLSRVMRLPGFYHRKDPDNPFMTRVMHTYDQLPYGPDDIIEGLQLILDEPEKRHLKIAPTQSQSGQRTIKNHTRDVTLTQRGASLRNAGYGYEKLLKALLEINAEECETPLSEKQVDKIARSVAKMGSYADESPESFGSNEPANEPAKKKSALSFIKTANELEAKEIEPLRWTVPDVIPQGLVVLAGAPKAGKSLLIQQISYAVAMGGPVMGKFPSIQGSVLHLALEDTEARFKLRMEAQKKLLHDAKAPVALQYATEWSFFPNAVDDIRSWCEATPDARLVVIDTMAKLFDEEKKSNGNVYRSEYREMTAFHKIAREFKLAVVIITHLNKASSGNNKTDPMMKVSGSAGVTGAADLVWTFERKSRDGMEAKIQSMGKDLADTIYRLHYDADHMSWICDNFEDAQQTNQISSLVKEYFAKIGNVRVTANQVADDIDKSRSHVAKALKELADGEYLLRYKGDWNSQVFCLNPTIF